MRLVLGRKATDELQMEQGTDAIRPYVQEPDGVQERLCFASFASRHCMRLFDGNPETNE